MRTSITLSLLSALLLIIASTTGTSQSFGGDTPLHPKVKKWIEALRDSGGSRSQISYPGSAGHQPFSADDDEYWDDRFGADPGSSGVNDEIFSMVSYQGELYIGGAFSEAGDIDVNNIVIWDGEHWRHVGPAPGVLQGTNGPINALAITDGTLFVGGQFDTAGAKPIQNVAYYDIVSRTWRNMGGVSSTSGVAFVSSLMIDGDDVYVGGNFDRAGNREVNNIAVYDRATGQWNALGPDTALGVEGTVNAITKGPDGVYIGGSFSAAGPLSTQGVARWDGSEWHSVGGGVNGSVNAIAVMDLNVFVGGEFDFAGDTAVNNIARWRPDTSTWTRLTGIFWLSSEDPIRLEGNGVDGAVRTMIVDGQDLMVGGTFRTAYPQDYTTSPAEARYVARWREVEGNPLFAVFWWAALGSGMDGFVNALEFFDGSLYAGGAFTRAGGLPAAGIANWDGNQWYNLATGASNTISTLSARGDDVWAGGTFRQPGQGSGTRIAELNDATWLLAPGTISGGIFTVHSTDEWVYAGGRFDGVANVDAKNIARYSKADRSWETLGEASGPNNQYGTAYVSAVLVDSPRVYLAGDFTSIDGMDARGIVRWNMITDTWDTLGRGINGQVFDLLKIDEKLYAGGRFLGAGDANDARNIAVWDGQEWSELGAGVNKVVWSLSELNGDIVAAGDFDTASTDLAVNLVAFWDPDVMEWKNLNQGLYGDFLPTASAADANDRYVYVAGNFQKAGSDTAFNIARWDGTAWYPLGSGLNSHAYAISVEDDRVYVAGTFNMAGGKPSFYFGVFYDPALSVDDEEHGAESVTISARPTLVSESSAIRIETNKPGRGTLRLFDSRGNVVMRVFEGEQLPTGVHTVHVPMVDLPSGTYFVRYENENRSETVRIVKQ